MHAGKTMLSIFGYGSLMQYDSVLRTMPNAVNHRYGTLAGWERVFSLVSVSSIRRETADFDTLELAALAIRPSANSDSLVTGCIFEIPAQEFNAFIEREQRYEVKQLQVLDCSAGTDKDNVPMDVYCVIEQTQLQYEAKLVGGEEEYEERVGKYYPVSGKGTRSGALWGRADILPVRPYLIMCIQAAAKADEEMKLTSTNTNVAFADNLLDGCKLADGVTRLRTYVLQHPERFPPDVMALASPSNSNSGTSARL